MRLLIIICILYTSLSQAFSQDAREVLKRVMAAQKNLHTVSYNLLRTDTFLDGKPRTIAGKAKLALISPNETEKIAYWGKRDDINQETIYDGNTAFSVNHSQQSYNQTSSEEMIPHLLGSPGGQMIFTELLRIDTSNVKSYDLKTESDHYVLTMHINDLPQYNIEKRFRRYKIDRATYLPVEWRSRQETLGAVQSLHSLVSSLVFNRPDAAYDFSSQRYPPGYLPEKSTPNTKLHALKNEMVFPFELRSFNDKLVSSASFAGKVVLLDFWEVWCGPCIASMPKVNDLFKKYNHQGFEVFGMMSEEEQLPAAMKLVEKNGLLFTNLISQKAIKKQFNIIAVPTYILLDRSGKVNFITEGFTVNLETEIQRLLAER
jgi:thiol-disulfide isomerase/thioredoxin